MQPKWYFDRFARPYLRNMVKLSIKELNQIDEFVNRLVPIKMKQKRFQNQSKETVKNSFRNGYISEVAIENYMETKFIHWKIREEEETDICDLKFLGIDVGIKTAEMGNLPLIYNFPKNPEIITILEKPNTVYVVGYATRNMLDYYKSNQYGFGKVMEYKSGYWGFHKLYDFKTIDELRMIYENPKINSFNNFTDTVKDYPVTEFLTFDF